MTWLTASMSMPRAAMSVATSTATLPDLKPWSARSRWGLRLVAVDRRGFQPVLLEASHHLVGAVLGAGEDKGALEGGFAQKIGKQRELVRNLRMDDMLHHLFDGGGDGRDLDAGRRLQQGVGKAGDFLRHGRREEEILPVLRQERGDAANGVDEAEVEHLVDFIEHEDLELAQADGAALDQIDETARGRHQDIDAALQGADLRGDADAAEYHGGVELQKTAVGAKALGDLRGKLASGGENERPAGPGFGLRLMPRKTVEHRQRKGSRLAGAGLGDAQEIAARQQLRYGA